MTKETLQGNATTEALMLTVEKVAAMIDCSTRHVYRLEDRGEMPRAVRLGNCVRWPRAVVEKWIEEGCPPRLAV
ncbi:MAG: helix-turn-helix domain-containing protein [Planctomycetes bacterium]|nr:helix-turn-helix domain-containing protein [Planctomycetota bacterium]